MENFDLKTDLITPRVAATLIPAFEAAYDLASFVANEHPFLSGELKEQIIPYLKNWAVEFELHRRTLTGAIPFIGSFENNSRNNHRHLELQMGRCLLTVSQTHREYELPRDCVFRNEHCLNGQMVLKEFRTDIHSKTIYAILTHGRGLETPGFIMCGVPNPDMKSWAQAVNLYDVVGNLEVVDVAPVSDEVKLGFRESVARKIEVQS